MNVVQLLEADHARVQELFEQVKSNEDGDNRGLFEKISLELNVHAEAEETIVYPFFLENGDEDLKKIVREGIEEHAQMKTVLADIESTTGDRDKFNAKLKVLIEDVEHHVEEEEGEMFSMAESQFEESQLEELGMLVEKEKATMMKSGTAKA